MSVYKYMLLDEFGGALRKFASKREAMPYMTEGMKLIKLPKQPSNYEIAMLTLGEAPF
jgi:hypothetical protein